MNRQVRVKSCRWHDAGAVTIEQAAVEYAKLCGMSNGPVEVRDESNPETIYTLQVERVTEYRVSRLRGGE